MTPGPWKWEEGVLYGESGIPITEVIEFPDTDNLGSNMAAMAAVPEFVKLLETVVTKAKSVYPNHDAYALTLPPEVMVHLQALLASIQKTP